MEQWDELLEQSPITRAAFGPTRQRGPRPMEREWGEFAKSDQDVIVYLAGMWNRHDRRLGWGLCSVYLGGDNYEGGHEHPALHTAAASVERILSPLAHEARVRIMQAMYDAPKSSGELSEATGLRGGNLHYHLKELIHAAYVSETRGVYDLTPLGCQMLMTVTMLAHGIVKDRGEEGLLIVSNWDEGSSPQAR